jgi:hypothetical protein
MAPAKRNFYGYCKVAWHPYTSLLYTELTDYPIFPKEKQKRSVQSVESAYKETYFEVFHRHSKLFAENAEFISDKVQ